MKLSSLCENVVINTFQIGNVVKLIANHYEDFKIVNKTKKGLMINNQDYPSSPFWILKGQTAFYNNGPRLNLLTQGKIND